MPSQPSIAVADIWPTVPWRCAWAEDLCRRGHWGLKPQGKEATRHGTCILHIIREGLLIVPSTLTSPSRLFPFGLPFCPSRLTPPSLPPSLDIHHATLRCRPVATPFHACRMRHRVAGPSCIATPSPCSRASFGTRHHIDVTSLTLDALTLTLNTLSSSHSPTLLRTMCPLSRSRPSSRLRHHVAGRASLCCCHLLDPCMSLSPAHQLPTIRWWPLTRWWPLACWRPLVRWWPPRALVAPCVLAAPCVLVALRVLWPLVRWWSLVRWWLFVRWWPLVCWWPLVHWWPLVRCHTLVCVMSMPLMCCLECVTMEQHEGF